MLLAAVTVCATVTLAGQAVPQPFPKPGQPQTPQTPVSPLPPSGKVTPAQPVAPPAQAGSEPAEGSLGLPVYPTAQFITSYDAGKGQRYYLYGTTATFAEMVQYYRTMLKQRGELVFEQPPVHQFDVARFREETMAFPPGVTIKDYTWGGLGGYLNPKRGAQPARFPTVIQIVPAPPLIPR